MQAEIIAVGSELLLGQIVDGNSAFIARHFAAAGLDLYFKTVVGDNLPRLEMTIRQALGRSHVVLTTGGIGPTADDVTREAVAAATDRELVFSEVLMAQVEAYFASRGFKLSPSNRRQAFIPAGAIAVENPVGTAPAFFVEVGDRCVITLPGVPREMQHLLLTRVMPYLRERYRLAGEIKLRVLKAVGLGESRIGELLRDFMEKGRNPTVGTMAHLGQVDIRIAAKGSDPDEAERLIRPVEAEIRGRLGDVVFGADDDTLEGLIHAGLRALGLRVALAELGSAGAVAERLCLGVGREFAGGVILAREEDAARLAAMPTGGAQPEMKAALLAEAVRAWAGAGVGVATYFQDVPGSDPPVTQVMVAVSRDGRSGRREYRLGGDLASLRIRCATLALDLLRRNLGPPP